MGIGHVRERTPKGYSDRLIGGSAIEAWANDLISTTSLELFIVTALVILLIPGPAVTYILTRSLTPGRRVGLASVAGVELASATYAVAATLGLTTILLESALAFSVVKYAGAAYLVYLGVTRILSRREANAPEQTPTSPFRAFTSGYLVNILNPKTAVFFYAFLPLFVNPVAGGVTIQILTLGLLWVALATCTDSAYALLGSATGPRVMRWLNGKASTRRLQRYAQGGVYVGLGVVAALEHPSGS